MNEGSFGATWNAVRLDFLCWTTLVMLAVINYSVDGTCSYSCALSRSISTLWYERFLSIWTCNLSVIASLPLSCHPRITISRRFPGRADGGPVFGTEAHNFDACLMSLHFFLQLLPYLTVLHMHCLCNSRWALTQFSACQERTFKRSILWSKLKYSIAH